MNPDPYAQLDPDTPPFRLDHVVNFLATLGLWVAIIVGVSAAVLIYWRLHSPETFEERFATPATLLSWRLWAYISWRRLCKRCGLSASEQVTRRDKEGGRQVTSTRWFHPKLLGTEVSQTTLRLTVRARMGQTVEDLERAVPAIRDAAGAHSARAVVVSPGGTLRIELIKREQLSTVRHAAPPMAVTTTRVTLGRREDGSDWILPLSGRHILTVGCSGAGKGSVFWGHRLRAWSCRRRRSSSSHRNRPEVRHRIINRCRAIHQDRDHRADAVATLAGLEMLMDKRGQGDGRRHTRAPADQGLTAGRAADRRAGRADCLHERPSLRKEAAASLSRILTKGRALGIVVAAFLQDPPQGNLADARPVHPNHRASTAIARRSHDGPR